MTPYKGAPSNCPKHVSAQWFYYNRRKLEKAAYTRLQYAFLPLEVSYSHTFGILPSHTDDQQKLNLQSTLVWISELFREATQRCPECPVGTDMEWHTTGWSPSCLPARHPDDDEFPAAPFHRLPPGLHQPARTGRWLAAQRHPCTVESVMMTDVCESSCRFCNAGPHTRPLVSYFLLRVVGHQAPAQEPVHLRTLQMVRIPPPPILG